MIKTSYVSGRKTAPVNTIFTRGNRCGYNYTHNGQGTRARVVGCSQRTVRVGCLFMSIGGCVVRVGLVVLLVVFVVVVWRVVRLDGWSMCGG